MTTTITPITIIIAPPVIQAVWNNIRVNVLDMFHTDHETLVRIQAHSGQPFADGAKSTIRTRFLTVHAGTLEQVTPMFTAHGHRWTVNREAANYSLYRWDGIIPRFVCMSSLDKFGLALRHLAERAEKEAGKPSGWYEFLYAWMDKEG